MRAGENEPQGFLSYVRKVDEKLAGTVSDPYFSHFPDIYSNVSVCSVFRPHSLGRYFYACNAVDNPNRMRQYYLALDKFWVTQSVYLRLATTVVLGMGIADGEILYRYGVAYVNVDKKISTLD